MKILAALALAFIAVGAQAQPSAREIVEQLTPRGISARGIKVEGQRERSDAPPSINLDVIFEYGSAQLSPDAKIVLDNLGQALNDPALAAARVQVAGHTDAAGSDAYNLDLSRRRAQSVADYLARQHSVPATRLSVEGYGKTRLLDAANPRSSVNRRVQILNLGSN